VGGEKKKTPTWQIEGHSKQVAKKEGCRDLKIDGSSGIHSHGTVRTKKRDKHCTVGAHRGKRKEGLAKIYQSKTGRLGWQMKTGAAGLQTYKSGGNSDLKIERSQSKRL